MFVNHQTVMMTSHLASKLRTSVVSARAGFAYGSGRFMSTSARGRNQNVPWSMFSGYGPGCCRNEISRGSSTKEGTIGAALDALEKRVRNAGIEFEFTSPTGQGWFTSPLHSTSEPCSSSGVSGKVLRSKYLIELAIIQACAFNNGCSDKDIVGTVDAETALKQGNVTGIRVDNGFLHMESTLVERQQEKLGLFSAQGRFLVIMGGMDTVAFYSPTHMRFLRMKPDGILSASESSAFHNDDRPRSDELFALTCLVNENRLYNKFHGKHGHLQSGNNTFQVVQVRGLDL